MVEVDLRCGQGRVAEYPLNDRHADPGPLQFRRSRMTECVRMNPLLNSGPVSHAFHHGPHVTITERLALKRAEQPTTTIEATPSVKPPGDDAQSSLDEGTITVLHGKGDRRPWKLLMLR